MIHSDHESLKYLKGQSKLNKKHAKWVEFIEQFPYVIKHKQGKTNMVADALSRRHTLLNVLDSKYLGFDNIMEIYKDDLDFSHIYQECSKGRHKDFFIHDGFFFKGKRLCVPQGSLRQSLFRETHEGGLMGHFGVAKTLYTLHDHFFWPHIHKFVHNFFDKCIACKKAKSKVQPHGLYTPFPIPDMSCVDISMDFILGLPKTSKSMDSIFVVVYWFSKMAHFIPCHKVDEACYIVNLFFKEVVRLHGLPRSIVSDKDSKFLSHFWKTLLEKIDTKLFFSTTCHPQTDGQTEVVNRTLGQMLRCLISRNPRVWENLLPHFEFAYNRVVNFSTSHTPFEVVYGFNPLTPFNLLLIPILDEVLCKDGQKASFIKNLHHHIKLQIERKVGKYAKHTNKGVQSIDL